MKSMQDLKRVLREHPLTRGVYKFFGNMKDSSKLGLNRLFFGRSFTMKYFDHFFTASPDPWEFRGSPIQEERRSLIIRLLSCKRYSRLLEIGCAQGWMTLRLAEMADQVASIDISRVALEGAREHCAGLYNVTFSHMDLVVDPLPAGSFDCIVCAGVLVYLPAAAESDVCHKVVASLECGGILLLEHVREAYPGEVPGRIIHELYRRKPELKQIHHLEVDNYAITVFRKGSE